MSLNTFNHFNNDMQADIIDADKLHWYHADTYTGPRDIQAYTFGQALRLLEDSGLDVLAICED